MHCAGCTTPKQSSTTQTQMQTQTQTQTTQRRWLFGWQNTVNTHAARVLDSPRAHGRCLSACQANQRALSHDSVPSSLPSLKQHQLFLLFHPRRFHPPARSFSLSDLSVCRQPSGRIYTRLPFQRGPEPDLSAQHCAVPPWWGLANCIPAPVPSHWLASSWGSPRLAPSPSHCTTSIPWRKSRA
ncbi:hypothetical protein BDU57DRAFT_95941 [Ampelomyces quisqualis]|uniref:Uncharacterized protein n=1 Tax=Ampelomyces quisqualis TaxID=50730 RepID=A0A6A5Q821_AMPQU|nr:hypothetical protein BDU57DRAFT_95941 [Ampelomyces quisqualis]